MHDRWKSRSQRVRQSRVDDQPHNLIQPQSLAPGRGSQARGHPDATMHNETSTLPPIAQRGLRSMGSSGRERCGPSNGKAPKSNVYRASRGGVKKQRAWVTSSLVQTCLALGMRVAPHCGIFPTKSGRAPLASCNLGTKPQPSQEGFTSCQPAPTPLRRFTVETPASCCTEPSVGPRSATCSRDPFARTHQSTHCAAGWCPPSHWRCEGTRQ